MFILARHILKQHVGPFLFGLFIITLLFMLNLIFKELGRILSKGLDFLVILEFFALNLSWIVALAVPMAVLMSCLMAFGQLSADHEITAIKASGISLYRIVAPVLIVSAGLTIFLIWFNNQVLPESNHRLRNLAKDIAIKKPTVNLEPGYLYQDIPNISIRVDHLIEEENLSRIRGVMIIDKSNSNRSKTIVSERGEIYVDESTGLLHLILYNGEIHEIDLNHLDQYNRIHFPKHAITIPIPNMTMQRSNSQYRGDREKSSEMMREDVRKNFASIEKREKNLITFINAQIKRNFPILSINDTIKIARPDSPILAAKVKKSYRMKSNLKKQIRITKNIIQRIKGERDITHNYLMNNNKLLVEIYKKYSIPFACIVFVFIGAPLGIMARKGNMGIGGAISLVFFIVYWIFLIGGEELADRDLLSPFIAMWIANFIVGGFGIYLFLKIVKETSFLNFKFLTRLIPKRFR